MPYNILDRFERYRENHRYDIPGEDGLMTQGVVNRINPENSNVFEPMLPEESIVTPEETVSDYTWDDFDREYSFPAHVETGVKTVPEESTTSKKVTSTSNKTGPRGYRNNNPLNIRTSNINWDGKVTDNTDGSFEQFVDMAHGYRAAFKNIQTQISRGNNTIAKLINAWAPASDGNNPIHYAQQVASAAGIGVNDLLNSKDKNVMTRIVAAMAKVENGQDADMRDVEAGWNLLT